MRAVIVHHDPSGPSAAEAIARLARAVERGLGVDTVACPVSELGWCETQCRVGVALFLARGGHFADSYAMLRESCDYVLGPVPLWITALHVASTIARTDVGGTVYLLYHEARRLRRQQAEDYAGIAILVERLLRSLYSVNARVVALGRGEAMERGISGFLLTVMPGKGERISLLRGEPGFSLVAGWILGGIGELFPRPS